MIALIITLALHALAAVIWVGGMAFAYAFLRPVAGNVLSPRESLRLWRDLFARFFPIVWVAVAVLLGTGYYLALGPFGGFDDVGMHIHVMHGLALLMTGIFAHLFFAPWPRFRRAVACGANGAAAAELGRIRQLIAVNLALGLIVVVVASGGRYWH